MPKVIRISSLLTRLAPSRSLNPNRKTPNFLDFHLSQDENPARLAFATEVRQFSAVWDVPATTPSSFGLR